MLAKNGQINVLGGVENTAAATWRLLRMQLKSNKRKEAEIMEKKKSCCK